MTDKRVPREPTPAMFIAGTKALAEADGSFARQVWYAMVDAAPAAPDEREPLGEPDAWQVTDPISPSQVFSERPEPSEIPGGCLVALYSEERIDALRRERDALKAALRMVQELEDGRLPYEVFRAVDKALEMVEKDAL